MRGCANNGAPHMGLLKWSNWEVFNWYTGRVVVVYSGPGFFAYLIAVWLDPQFDYEDMNTVTVNAND